MNEEQELPGKILIVDDTPANIDVLGKTLEEEGYEISAAPTGEIALEIADNFCPDLILLDIMMPGIDGFETCNRLKENPITKDIAVIFISALNDTDQICKGFDHGGMDYITKPFRREEVLARVRTHIKLRTLLKQQEKQNQILEQKVQDRTKELRDTRLEVINRLGLAGEYRDNETGMHVVRMSQFSARLGLEAGMSIEESELLLQASPMHDIGKIGIPDSILLKPGKLDPKEREIMNTHVDIGAEILSGNDSSLMQMAKAVALHHHEKWDGSGYPKGLKGKEISFEGRIVAICDVFDALTSERPYKKAWTIENAMEFLEEKKGTHFQPDLVDKFKIILPEVIEIRSKFSDDKEL